MDHQQPGAGDVEVIVPEPGSSVRWWSHGYPDPLARWHHHPEIEFHLITAGSGQMLVGNRAVSFTAGQVVLVGPHLPHNWLSDLAPGETLPTRDVLCQVLPAVLLSVQDALPELGAVTALVERSRRGIELSGAAARRAAELLVGMGRLQGMARLGCLLQLAEVFSSAPSSQWHHLVGPDYVPALDSQTAHRVNTVLDYVEEHLVEGVSMEEAAALVALSPSAFSRFFHATAGLTFSELVRRRRVARACHLLRTTDLPVTRVCEMSGYQNLANFNRRFRQVTGTTPSAYRRGRQA